MDYSCTGPIFLLAEEKKRTRVTQKRLWKCRQAIAGLLARKVAGWMIERLLEHRTFVSLSPGIHESFANTCTRLGCGTLAGKNFGPSPLLEPSWPRMTAWPGKILRRRSGSHWVCAGTGTVPMRGLRQGPFVEHLWK